MINAFLFDLDGTLLDTAPDLALAINKTRQSAGLLPMPHAWIRSQVSHGGQAMIMRSFADYTAEQQTNYKQQFLEHYFNNPCQLTTFFPGIMQLLSDLNSRKIPWGIMTNKPRWLTEPIVQQLKITCMTDTIICGDDLPRAKPFADPLLHACEQMAATPTNTLYIGDAERDIQAARAAKMPSAAVLYGYIPENDSPESWGADFIVETPAELLTIADNHE